MRLSRTRSSVSRLSDCGTTPSCERISGPYRSGSSPRMLSSPAVRVETAPIIRMVVDLPAPLGPRSPKDSPASTSKLMPSTAGKSLYFLTRSAAVMTDVGIVQHCSPDCGHFRRCQQTGSTQEVRSNQHPEPPVEGTPMSTETPASTDTTAAPRRRSPFARREPDSGPRARFSQLLPYLLEHRGVLSFVVVLSVLGAAASLAQPLLVSQVITIVGKGEPLNGIVWGLVALVVVSALISGYQHYLLQRTGEGVVLSSRRKLVGRM